MSNIYRNVMELTFSSLSENEAFARIAVAAFVSQLDPSLDELNDIKTVVSEAVTNAIIHGYEEHPEEQVYIRAEIQGTKISIQITDKGVGIDDIGQARQPLFTSKPELERSGMGFTIMENFMDEVTIRSNPGQGTTVYLVKQLKNHPQTMAN
ncbi:anti-sigma F factor [Shimazuella sp. AN120528]|uniref:anti-sigma F factor n=1 Tax=Shimazuella soli TaxID=1892854 RepID=UPI001F0E1FDB|nr:anti-sigma F factor [Shimazuella soli]MCH5584262.1 anti-sigma F factor [Shimazuella soli]